MAKFFTGALTQVGGLDGTEQIPFDFAGGGSERLTVAQIAEFAAGQTQVGRYAIDASTADFTATVGEMAGSEICVLDLTGVLAAGKNVTTPSAAGLIGGTVLKSWVLRIVNNSSAAFDWTLLGGSGVTVVGTATIGQHTWREWLVVVVSGAVTMQNIGSGGN